MKNAKEVIKKDLLRRKIKEFFSKNPNSKTIIVQAGTGNTKTLWKVSKQKKGFNIVEVNTVKDKYIFEFNINELENDVDQWNPDSETGEFQRTLKKVGIQQTMLQMPDQALKKYFGLNKASLTQPDAKLSRVMGSTMSSNQGRTRTTASITSIR